MKKISIVIPVYGQWHLVKRNIDALLQYDRAYIEEIFLIDDCSPDKNPYQFDSSIVEVITNQKNVGYTATVNNGLRRVTSEFILLLDSDAYPVKPFLKKLIEIYNSDERIGCIGFRTVDRKGNETGNYQYEPSVAGLIAGQKLEAKFDFLRFWRSKNILPYSCAVSFRKLCLQELNYFDEKIFKVLDADNDISMRIHRSNWKLIFTREIIVCHEGGNSYKVNYKRVLLFHESRWRLLKKHKLIEFPFITKALIKGRVSLEVIFLWVLSTIKANSNYKEKLQGRKILLKKINSYE